MCGRLPLISAAAVVLAACIYNLPRLIGGTVQFDSLEVHYAGQRFLADELHAGRLPLWTPFIFSGFPFLADLQVGAWYPLNWPFFLLGITPASINAELLLHTAIACLGAYALALRLIGRTLPAIGAGFFYGLSGWFAAHSQHVAMVDTAAWVPWLVLLLEWLAVRITAARLALAALVGAAIALPGSFQIALYAFSFVVVWAVLESVWRRSWSTAGRFGAGLAAVALWGGLLAAVMILPALELVSQSIRAQLNAREVGIGYFHPAALLTLVDPDFYGLLSGHYSGPGDSTQHYFYAGLVLVPLTLLGARDARILRSAVFLGLPFVWYAVGPSGGLFQVASRLPGFRSVELPMHGWFLPALGFALLGGAGIGRLEIRFGTRVAIALLTFAVIDTTAVNQFVNPLAFARGSFEALYEGALQVFQAEATRAKPSRVWGPELAKVAYRNHALQSRVETTYGYNPLELAAYNEYVAAAERNPRLVAGFAASHALTSDARLTPSEPHLALAYFARSVALESKTGALDELDPSVTTLLSHQVPPGLEFDSSSSVAVAARGEGSLTLRYTSKTANVVRIAIPAYPGWSATLNDRELPLELADRAFIGVVVPPGEGVVRLEFSSRWFWDGAVLSTLALLAALAAFIRRGFLRERPF